MASIVGVRAYVQKAVRQEKAALSNLERLLSDLPESARVYAEELRAGVRELRNLSRDVGWMRRLLADLIHTDIRQQERRKNASQAANN